MYLSFSFLCIWVFFVRARVLKKTASSLLYYWIVSPFYIGQYRPRNRASHRAKVNWSISHATITFTFTCIYIMILSFFQQHTVYNPSHRVRVFVYSSHKFEPYDLLFLCGYVVRLFLIYIYCFLLLLLFVLISFPLCVFTLCVSISLVVLLLLPLLLMSIQSLLKL